MIADAAEFRETSEECGGKGEQRRMEFRLERGVYVRN